MRLLGKGESYSDIVKFILMWMQSAGLPEQVQGLNETIAMDRGYLLAGLIEYLCARGFHIIGTFKRIKSAPFAFGGIAHSNCRLVMDKGAKSIYVARKKFADKRVYGIAYRGGRGRVVMLFSTAPRTS